MTTDKTDEDIRFGYQAAITLATYEGTLSWTALASFTPILFAFIAGAFIDHISFITNPKAYVLLNLISSILGAVTSYLWFSATLRSRYYHKYWIASARQLESRLQVVNTLQSGKSLTKLETLAIDGEIIRFPHIARHSHTKTLTFLYGFSCVIFIALLLYHSQIQPRSATLSLTRLDK